MAACSNRIRRNTWPAAAAAAHGSAPARQRQSGSGLTPPTGSRQWQRPPESGEWRNRDFPSKESFIHETIVEMGRLGLAGLCVDSFIMDEKTAYSNRVPHQCCTASPLQPSVWSVSINAVASTLTTRSAAVSDEFVSRRLTPPP